MNGPFLDLTVSKVTGTGQVFKLRVAAIFASFATRRWTQT
jgi:hypothetical protein